MCFLLNISYNIAYEYQTVIKMHINSNLCISIGTASSLDMKKFRNTFFNKEHAHLFAYTMVNKILYYTY